LKGAGVVGVLVHSVEELEVREEQLEEEGAEPEVLEALLGVEVPTKFCDVRVKADCFRVS
jgi:transcription antitermination factor NusA-like protein